MRRDRILAAALSAAFLITPALKGAQPSELEQLKQQLEALKQHYETQVKQLEQRIGDVEQQTKEQAEANEQIQAAAAAPPTQERANAFNPAIGVVLIGTYGQFSRDPSKLFVPGFMQGDESGPGERGFSLGESEFNAHANVDDLFYGNFTLSLADEDNGDTKAELEEAWVQTLALPEGFTARGGRFFSNIGYLNKFHPHADDFVDRPLPHRVMLNKQYFDDGVQLRWIAPTDLFLELGGEWLRGAHFPAAGAGHNGRGVWTAFGDIGGDIGLSHSWQTGLSYLSARANDRESGAQDDPNHFTGKVKMAIADLVWKWAPNGNPYRNNFKAQGALFWQNQDGVFTPAGGSGLNYDKDQLGWYLQGVYQFIPRWRLGLRYAQLYTDNPGPAFDGTELDPLGHTPRHYSAMLDWSPSEFSRLRMQYNRDGVQAKAANEIFFQYIMSLGAHGAHEF